jgi:hypothetical protein
MLPYFQALRAFHAAYFEVRQKDEVEITRSDNVPKDVRFGFR